MGFLSCNPLVGIYYYTHENSNSIISANNTVHIKITMIFPKMTFIFLCNYCYWRTNQVHPLCLFSVFLLIWNCDLPTPGFLFVCFVLCFLSAFRQLSHSVFSVGVLSVSHRVGSSSVFLAQYFLVAIGPFLFWNLRCCMPGGPITVVLTCSF
jgi:hypothetical protein